MQYIASLPANCRSTDFFLIIKVITHTDFTHNVRLAIFIARKGAKIRKVFSKLSIILS